LKLVAALAVLATAPIGVAWVGWGQLGVLLVVAFGFVMADDIIGLRSGSGSFYLSPVAAARWINRR
jgi:hypothetical protein